MRLLSTIGGKIDDLFRVAVGESDDLRLRAVKQQDIMDRFRTMPEFGVLLDHLDGEWRVLLRKFADAKAPEEALEAWREAKALIRVQDRLEKVVTAKARGAAMEEQMIRRQTELLKVDQVHTRQNLDAQAQQGQNGRHA